MPHAIWKGAISFGLVHVPVTLYPASIETGVDFDWLDQRTMDPVGYRRINKRTGKEVAREHIVKGVKLGDGDYVVLSDDEIKAAYPKTTQTIEIQSFAQAGDLALTQLEKPYYLEPAGKADKVYALLREAMHGSGVVGIARVVLHTKEYLAAVMPTGPALMMITLRWASEIRPWQDIRLPPSGQGALKDGELKMARQLIAEMTAPWRPDAYDDRFTQAIHDLVAARAKAGKTEHVRPLEPEPASSSNVVDLTALLTQSLKGASKPRTRSAARARTARARS